MVAWCNSSDIADRLAGDAPDYMLNNAASSASSLLYVLSGRAIKPIRRADREQIVDRRGLIRLTNWAPIHQVISVQIDGVEVPGTVSDGRTMIMVHPKYRQRWASVSFSWGSGVPDVASSAAAALAAQLVRSEPLYRGDDSIDPRLSTVSRQEVTYTYRDLGADVKNEIFSVYEVDVFLRAVNPNGVRHQPKVVAR